MEQFTLMVVEASAAAVATGQWASPNWRRRSAPAVEAEGGEGGGGEGGEGGRGEGGGEGQWAAGLWWHAREAYGAQGVHQEPLHLNSHKIATPVNP